MKLGIIYAGQGSQVVGMGKSFYPREIFDQNEDLKELCFNGPLEKLSYTPYTQPCMVMVATIITDLLKEHGIVPDYTAGLSLGEYSALYCAGVFKRQQVIDLARFRGKVMQEAVSEIESEMIAVLGMKEELLQDLLKEASLALKERFKKETFHEMKIPVIFNTLGHEIEYQSIPEILEKQVMSPVYFEKSIRYMIDQGVDTIIEVGPGKVLSGFVRKIDRSIQLYQIEDMESLKKTVKALKGE